MKKISHDIPRRINMICSRLFLHGCVEELHQLSINDAKVVLTEIQHEQLTSKNIPSDVDFEADDIYEKPELASVETLADVKESKKSLIRPVNTHKEKTKAVPPSNKSLYSTSTPEAENLHSGPETRNGERRSGNDRRSEVRFGSENKDRRQNPGRRGEKQDFPKKSWLFWKKG